MIPSESAWPPPPSSIEQLLQRARLIEGRTVGELAAAMGQPIDPRPARSKGRVGELVERALGAHARSLDLPDFPDLGVELKTIPLDERGHVCESTFVCTVDLARAAEEEWESSRLWRKLRRVLWVPVESAKQGPLTQRRFGTAQLWYPNDAETNVLRDDWLQLMGQIAIGGIEEISGHLGTALQVRPKAADGSVRTVVLSSDGEVVSTVPRGFYLRARFTEALLWRISAAPG